MKHLWIFLFIFLFVYTFAITGCSDDPPNIPAASTRLVVLFYPDNDAILPNSSITFTWFIVAENADSFKLQISQDSLFASNVETYGTTSSDYTVDPTGDTNYFYWKVTGYWRSHGDSDVSLTRKFKQR